MKKRIPSKIHSLKSIVWKEWKYFVAQCLNVDVSSFGDTDTDALANLKEALELYFEDNKNIQISEVKEARLVTQEMTYA